MIFFFPFPSHSHLIIPIPIPTHSHGSMHTCTSHYQGLERNVVDPSTFHAVNAFKSYMNTKASSRHCF